MNQERSADGSPSISVIFPDGYIDNLILYKADNFDGDRSDNECLYSGHLEKEKSACVAMTGCPGIEDVHFTIFSKHATRSSAMKWKLDGSVDILDNVSIHRNVKWKT